MTRFDLLIERLGTDARPRPRVETGRRLSRAAADHRGAQDRDHPDA
jgi:hypothetical protein